MATDVVDRRRAQRQIPESGQALSRVRLRTGRELVVIDVSSLGALVEGPTRLLPGTHVDVHITAIHGRVLVRARVVRCSVWGLTADVVQYRGALAFAAVIDLAPGSAREAENLAPSAPGDRA